MTRLCDVAIIGGGPGGSTAGSILKKYNPGLNVMIFEREKFPRDHIGESLLPRVCEILDELEVWDEMEAADFPIKIGATYRWGSKPGLWSFDFLSAQEFREEARPARYEGQRRSTAFQVDRSKYDQILLNKARAWGCEVFEETRIVKVRRDPLDPDRVSALELEDGTDVEATYYIDASGNAAILRRSMDVPIDEPTLLQNIAIWDYWQNTDWAVEIGVGGTRIQVMSLGWGWIWFIPIGPTRTSIGLVVPAAFYKEGGKRPEELYLEAVAGDPRIAGLLRNATREGQLAATKDWSFVAERWVGANWFLVGEAGGFADPILSAGLTLTHTSAREAAYVVLELERGRHDPEFLKSNYGREQAKRVRQHMRFAEFWYSSNGQFTDLKEYCSTIAESSGLKLNADAAFAWLGTGGFANDTLGVAGIGGFSVEAIKLLLQRLTETGAKWEIGSHNVFKFNIEGAQKSQYAAYFGGEIILEDALVRNGSELPFTGLFGVVIQAVQQSPYITDHANFFLSFFSENPWMSDINDSVRYAFHTLESLVAMGWITASIDRTRPGLLFETPLQTAQFHDDFAVSGGARI
jgi:flavin-dependent dehydrogenase